MTYILRHQGMDDPLEETRYQTLDAAISAVVDWFFGGYEDIMTSNLRQTLQEDALVIRDKLSKGEEYYCQRFHERISVQETAD